MEELYKFIDEHVSLFRESTDSSALKTLIEDLILHSEDEREGGYLLIQHEEMTTMTTEAMVGSKARARQSYSLKESILLENCGIIVRNPSNANQIKLADFF